MITLPISPDAPVRILEELLLPKLHDAQKLLAAGNQAGAAKALRDLENWMYLLGVTIEKLSGGQP